MNYFILTPYWTRHYKENTYWCANSNGYTSIIANAGIYDEFDKEKMEKLHNLDRCTFIPITKELLDKGIKQLNKIDKKLLNIKNKIEEDYKRNLKELEEDKNKNQMNYKNLYKIAEECEL